MIRKPYLANVRNIYPCFRFLRVYYVNLWRYVMKWLELAATDFEEALQKSEGVVLIPVGSIEIHGPHLPVGCDTLVAGKVVEMVAEREPVVVAPVMAYTMAPVARLHPGGISLPPELLVEHLQKVCDELARNGYNKIILVHAHGGNVAMHHMILSATIDRAKPYSLYSIPPLAGAGEVIAKLKESDEYGHACEVETSLALYVFPELCHMDRVKGKIYNRQRDLDVGPAATPVDWAANYPHYAVGDASKASAEKGEKIMNAWVDTVVDVVRKVKKDDVVANIMARFSG
jgi:creatinine amidohydrolase